MPDLTPEDGAPTIGVVVVAYRSTPTLEACLRPLLVDSGVVSIVVQDNSSDDVTRASVESLGDSRLRYFPDVNVGFAAGCNRGVEHLAGDVDWVAFVNPDVELERSLSELVALPGLGVRSVVGAQVESPRAPGVLSARRRVTRARELLKAVLGPRVYAMRAAAVPDGVIRVDQVSGALLLVRSGDFTAWGGFDTRFELYYEDVDLCARAPGGCAFVPQQWGRHVGGASSGSGADVSGAAYAAGRVSRMRYLRKHAPGATTEVTLVMLAGVEWVARSVGRASEGPAARRAGLRAQLQELRRPGSVRMLGGLSAVAGSGSGGPTPVSEPGRP